MMIDIEVMTNDKLVIMVKSAQIDLQLKVDTGEVREIIEKMSKALDRQQRLWQEGDY